jgi:anti-anti-sigma factor
MGALYLRAQEHRHGGCAAPLSCLLHRSGDVAQARREAEHVTGEIFYCSPTATQAIRPDQRLDLMTYRFSPDATDDDALQVLPAFNLTVEPHREVLWIKLAGELDVASGPVLGERVRELRAVGFDQLIVDLRALSFIDVAGVRQLLSLARDAHEVGWQLWLIPGREPVQKLFGLTGTLDQLPFETPVSALKDDPPKRCGRVRSHTR